ncbi:YdeI family protein [Flavobacterium sp. W22_SRS_FK3]|uniref:YdeI/OmpD-associated family protein n=1 Tax=Flavobacterium sp. W22_SRS_FK3 TaxID=3240275 RepID=UPI003F8DC57A
MNNTKVDFYFSQNEKWQKETRKLRTIILDCQLTEELKWGTPCYTYQKNNIVLIHDFKEYCALLFFKGALLKDTEAVLIQQSANVQLARQIRFKNLHQIIKLEPVLKKYIYQAVEVEKAGVKFEFKKTEDFETAAEFQKKLDDNPDLKTAFEALTPGRQKAYKLFFSAPKQSKTRESRVEKSIPKILIGKGLND